MISSSSYVIKKFLASRIPYNPYIPIKIPTAAIDISAQDKFLTIKIPAAIIPMHKSGIQIRSCMRTFFRVLFFISVSFLRFSCLNRFYHFVALLTIHLNDISLPRFFSYATIGKPDNFCRGQKGFYYESNRDHCGV